MNPRPYVIFLLSFLFSFTVYAQSIPRIDSSSISIEDLDQQIQGLKEAAHVHGLTVSIFTSDRMLFQKAYGFRNLKEKLTLQTSNNFYAASLSKPLFGYIVMKLVEEGKIDLDEPLINYLEKPLYTYDFPQDYEGYQDLVDDQRHEKITARMCLSHSTGFPNWRYIGKTGINMARPLVIEFEPGTFYSYSGEGIQLLQFVVEQISQKSLEELAQYYVFEPFEMKMTSFVWQDRFDANLAVGHYKKKKILERRKRDVAYAAGSMDTTPEDYAQSLEYKW